MNTNEKLNHLAHEDLRKTRRVVSTSRTKVADWLLSRKRDAVLERDVKPRQAKRVLGKWSEERVGMKKRLERTQT